MTFYEIIYNWVELNFGPHEAQDPSWDIKSLAEHLSESDIAPDELNANTKWRAFDELREFNLEQDIAQVAEQKGINYLSKADVETIKHRYYKLDDETWEQISMIMDDLNLKKGK